ncbi:MAG: hypothetical protein ACYC6M_15040 [Terriglobales bacterium]
MALPASAHVGSPDVYFDGMAGPYHLQVVIAPPPVIPGLASIDVRVLSGSLQAVRVTPLRLVGPAAKLAPVADLLQRSSVDPALYTGRLWLMARGAWQVRIMAEGSAGPGELAIPVAAVAQRTLPMQHSLGAILGAALLLLAVAMISIVGAGAREAKLDPGLEPAVGERRHAVVMMTVTAVLVFGTVLLGYAWWGAEARGYARTIYTTPHIQAELTPDGHLDLTLPPASAATGVPGPRSLDQTLGGSDLLPDHGHLMHLFLVRLPAMDRFYHLHPEQTAAGHFVQALPAMAAGRYQVFADVVHDTGFPETLVAQLDVPSLPGTPLTGDDAAAMAPPLPETSGFDTTKVLLANTINLSAPGAAQPIGYMVWERNPGPLSANHPYIFHFQVQDAAGNPVTDLEPYMGMAGHAEFVRTDLSVFAHVHPEGTVAMASMALAVPDQTEAQTEAPPGTVPRATMPTSRPEASMPGMSMPGTHIGDDVTFLYGFPKPGAYRIFVQVKRRSQIETGVFDTLVR